MDESAALRAFQDALRTQRPEFGQFFLARLLGLDISYPDGQCLIVFEPQDFLFNPQGSLHGGIIATVMDISMGHLLNHVQGAGLTLEMKTQYLKAVHQGTVYCRGEFLQRGRSVSFLKSTLTDAQGEPLAMATSTWKALSPARAPGVDAAAR
ncbi:PaaI family thioesterase [Bordetella parapertussis]|uniref:Thioesterase domain-containing protein n=2 Tax=Bordetella parapertussis TaxID=519 RepID=Q7W339_BORPA|nr:PaaI family thioesterase [Bordetella parapertussis]AOB41087.1 thioesterase [Bordetella parapertussis]AUL45127.1 thioesterase [Bordetella parapertussis]AWP65028.1 thioesterase [Bordetella parapertussis]AWP72537.1 thioesterase [Bordetella parapertussis]AWP91138.1 thioesterase [Bordetella parapertussis]